MRNVNCVRILSVVALVTLILGVPSQAFGDAAWIVFRDTIGGSMAGLLVGLAIAAASEGSEDDGGAVRWGFVTGTFAGLGLGIYQATREASSEKESLLNFEPGKALTFVPALPEPVLRQTVTVTGEKETELALRLRVVGVRF